MTLPAPSTEPTDERAGVEEALPGSLLGRVCVGIVVVHMLVRFVCAFLTAYLLARPVLYLLLVPAVSAGVAGGVRAEAGELSLSLVVAAGLFGAIGVDIAYWYVGRRYEHRLRQDLVKLGGVPEHRVVQAERLMGKYGFWILVVRFFLPVPNIAMQTLAGAGGMKLRLFLAGSVLGGLLWVGLLVGVGYAIGEPALPVIEAITRNALKVTLVLVVLVVIWVQIKGRRARTTGSAPRS